MRHAGDAALDRIESLLDRLRTLDGLKEKKRGIFYRKTKPFLHFHEDAAGLFADVRNQAGQFERRRVETLKEQAACLAAVSKRLK